MRLQCARSVSVVIALAAATSLTMNACSSTAGPGAVFQDAPSGGETTYIVNVAEPTDIILFFQNTTGDSVHLTAISVPGASPAMRLISTAVYDRRRIGYSPATALGILPKECPNNFVPHPVNSLTIGARETSPWIGVVAVRFSKPGTYLMRKFRIDYTTSRGTGWQDLVDPIRLTVREPAMPGPTPEPPAQC